MKQTEQDMPGKLRRIVGAALLVTFVPLYAVFAVTIAAARLPGTSVATQTLFYAVTGLIWVIPAGAVVWWMRRR
jgi:hypothetical protein